MIAYYVHDDKKENDVIVIPDRQCTMPVDRERLEAFISVDPVFASWPGDSCGLVSPEDFGMTTAMSAWSIKSCGERGWSIISEHPERH